MLAECRRARAVVPGWSGGNAKRPAGITTRSGDRVLELLVVTPDIELGDVIHLVACDHPLGRDVMRAKGFNNRSRRLRPGPNGDDLIENIVIGFLVEQFGGPIAAASRDQSVSSRTDSATHASSSLVG